MRLRFFLPLLVLCCLGVAAANHVVNAELSLARVNPNGHINALAWDVRLPGWFIATGLGGGVHSDWNGTRTEDFIVIIGGGICWALLIQVVISFAQKILSLARPPGDKAVHSDGSSR